MNKNSNVETAVNIPFMEVIDSLKILKDEKARNLRNRTHLITTKELPSVISYMVGLLVDGCEAQDITIETFQECEMLHIPNGALVELFPFEAVYLKQRHRVSVSQKTACTSASSSSARP